PPPGLAGVAPRHRIHRVRPGLPARHHAGGGAHPPAHGLPARRRLVGAGRDAGQRRGQLRRGLRAPALPRPGNQCESSAPGVGRNRDRHGAAIPHRRPQPGLEHRNPRSQGTTGVRLASHHGRGGMAFVTGGRDLVKSVRLSLAIALVAALAGCGQKGPLYLPEKTGEIVTRPTQTPPAAPSPAQGEVSESPNSPETADSPEQQASPAPEVVLPTPAERDQKKKQEAAKPKP